METMRPPTPISVPAPVGGIPGTSGGEVMVDTTKNSDIDSKPDARTGGAPPATSTTASGATPATGTPAAGTDAKKAAQIAPPTNYQTLNLKQKQKKPKKAKQRRTQ